MVTDACGVFADQFAVDADGVVEHHSVDFAGQRLLGGAFGGGGQVGFDVGALDVAGNVQYIVLCWSISAAQVDNMFALVALGDDFGVHFAKFFFSAGSIEFALLDAQF